MICCLVMFQVGELFCTRGTAGYLLSCHTNSFLLPFDSLIRHRAKILNPIERRLLLEGNVSKPVLPTISQKSHWVTNMKAAFKAGRRCSNHQPRSSATSRHQPTSLSTTTQHCRLYRSQRCILQLEQQPREDLNLLHNTWRSKRKRSDSEAFTNGSNKRFRKPD